MKFLIESASREFEKLELSVGDYLIIIKSRVKPRGDKEGLADND